MKEVRDHHGNLAGAPSRIIRHPAEAASREYDVIVVGGGIFGVMIAAEATDRGASVLLLEKNDFGGATSFNSLKTIHGGLRYLQSLDVVGHRRFVGERRWFLKRFPYLVERLPVLMPLYDRGVRRPLVMRTALATDRLLSVGRNVGLSEDRSIPGGTVLGPADVRKVFPGVAARGLSGGAVWYDACMPDSQRLIMEILRWACGQGLRALNYVSAQQLLTSRGGVRGVGAHDHIENEDFEFRGTTVVNATGPWCREVCAEFDQDYPELFQRSVAWNILIDRPALSNHALAVAPPRANGQVYFIHPWKGRMLVGTGHSPRSGEEEGPAPTRAELHLFLDEINKAVPGLGLSESDVGHVYYGYLPVRRPGSTDLTSDAVILDHGRSGGPRGLISVAGNKFTSSRHTAERLMRHLKMRRDSSSHVFNSEDIARRTSATTFAFDWMPGYLNTDVIGDLSAIIRDESVVHLDDLVLRRTGIGDNPQRALTLTADLMDLFDWDPARKEAEMSRLEQHFCWSACYVESPPLSAIRGRRIPVQSR
jgi:glycerol-3-phosphate dehydrogenase